MGYVLGQFNQPKVDYIDAKNSINTRYMTLIDRGTARVASSVTDIGVTGLQQNITFYNECIDASFKRNQNYYFHAKIKRMSSSQVFDIFLLNDGDNEKTQFIKTITVKEGLETEWADLELIFTPVIDFNRLLFQLRRTASDYQVRGRRCTFVYEELSEIKSPDDLASKNFIKIGVQSHPGLIMSINKEEIHVGNSGVYELRNGIVKVDFFSVINTAIEVTPIKIGDISYNSMEEYLAYMAAKTPIAQNDEEHTNSECIFGNSKLRAIDAFTLDYMYEEEN